MIPVTNYSRNKVLVSVSDEGIGIPEGVQENVFEKFGRVKNERTKHVKGWGLGLWAAREIIKAHDGDIWYENQPGSGSFF